MQCSLRSEYSLHDARTATRRPTSYSGGVYGHWLNKWSQIAQCIMLITSSIADTENYGNGQCNTGINTGDI